MIPDRYRMLMDGDITIDDLDEEEIMRGQLRNAAGDFRGRPPQFIPRTMMTQIIERRNQIHASQIQPLVGKAVKRLSTVLEQGSHVNDGPSIQAAKLALEYGLGKPVEKVAIQADVKITQYENIVEASVIPIDAPEGDI